MASTKTLQRSFAGGEVAPELHGRIDLVKYQTGLARCENFQVLPHGPVRNRPGFEFVNFAQAQAAGDAAAEAPKVRVIPFAFNTEQTYVLELGAGYVRIYTQGAALLDDAALTVEGVTQANPAVLTYSGASDPAEGAHLYLTGIGGMTWLSNRFVRAINVDTVGKTFEVWDDDTPMDTTAYPAYTSGGDIRSPVTVTTSYAEADLFDIHFVQSADVLTLVHPGYPPAELRRTGATTWSLADIDFVPAIATPDAPTATATVAPLPSGAPADNPITHHYKITAIADDTLEESLASAEATASNDLNRQGNYNSITPTTLVTGAVRYNIYKLDGVYGYIGQSDGSAFKDVNITADISQTPPDLKNPFDATDTYPGAVGYYEQRRCFAGSNDRPQNFWGTRSATENNLSYSIPQRDDDSIQFRIAAREVNRIRHILSLDQLFLLTSGGEWKVAPQNSDVLTPTTASPKQVSSEGASNVTPVVTASSVLFVQDTGSRMRELKYQWEANGYNVSDISLMAPHLFDEYKIVDMAYAKSPYRFIWCVRSDGVLLCLTYLPEQQVVAWSQHRTAGRFKSVACIQEAGEYVLYAVVERFLQGRWKNCIERMRPRFFSSHEDAFFVDSGLTYKGPPTTTVRGMWHLEGQEVSILADGAVPRKQTITDGAIVLDQPASTIHIGLPMTAYLQTLPLSFEAQAAGQGYTKNVNEIIFRVKETSGLEIGPDFDQLVAWTLRRQEAAGLPPALFSGLSEFQIMPEWGLDAQVCIRQAAPLPACILSMTLDTAVGG
ncbi:hypothetical protein ABS755_08070 [Castellaniella sp. FW104-16D08]|uniref:hypothetical protein n=1 Tax=unclassified Castellaniella TaxID=2617606 RepID=UPI003315578A